MMGSLRTFFVDREPALVGQVVAAALGLVVTLGLDIPAAVQAALVALVVALVGMWTRQHVTPEAKAVERETVAAGEAALRTAIDLSNRTAGAVGDVTEEALEVVGDVVEEVTGTEEDEAGSIPLAVLIAVGIVIFVFIGLAVCTDAIFEDEDEKNDLGWAPGIESSERPGGRDGPGRDGEDEGDCDGSCGNRPGNDCNQSQNCSDDDQLQVGPICIEDGACRFG